MSDPLHPHTDSDVERRPSMSEDAGSDACDLHTDATRSGDRA